MSKKYVYVVNGDEVTNSNQHDTIHDAIAEALTEREPEIGDKIIIHIAESFKLSDLMRLHGDTEEFALERLGEEIGEAAELWVFSGERQLEKLLRETADKWADENNMHPTPYKCGEVVFTAEVTEELYAIMDRGERLYNAD